MSHFSYLDIALIIATFPGMYAWGRILGIQPALGGTLAGAAFLAMIVSILANLYAGAIKWFLWTTLALGYLWLVLKSIQTAMQRIPLRNRLQNPAIRSFVFLILIGLVLLGLNWPKRVFLTENTDGTFEIRYNLHSNYYAAPATDMLTADYPGRLRVSLAWPHPYQRYHFFSGALKAVPQAFLPHPGLFTQWTALTIFMILMVLALLESLFLSGEGGRAWKIFLGACWLIFGFTFYADVLQTGAVSSYTLSIPSLMLFFVALKERHWHEAVVWLAFLSVSSIFLVPVACLGAVLFLYLTWRFQANIFSHPKTLVTAGILGSFCLAYFLCIWKSPAPMFPLTFTPPFHIPHPFRISLIPSIFFNIDFFRLEGWYVTFSWYQHMGLLVHKILGAETLFPYTNYTGLFLMIKQIPILGVLYPLALANALTIGFIWWMRRTSSRDPKIIWLAGIVAVNVILLSTFDKNFLKFFLIFTPPFAVILILLERLRNPESPLAPAVWTFLITGLLGVFSNVDPIFKIYGTLAPVIDGLVWLLVAFALLSLKPKKITAFILGATALFLFVSLHQRLTSMADVFAMHGWAVSKDFVEVTPLIRNQSRKEINIRAMAFGVQEPVLALDARSPERKDWVTPGNMLNPMTALENGKRVALTNCAVVETYAAILGARMELIPNSLSYAARLRAAPKTNAP